MYQKRNILGDVLTAQARVPISSLEISDLDREEFPLDYSVYQKAQDAVMALPAAERCKSKLSISVQLRGERERST